MPDITIKNIVENMTRVFWEDTWEEIITQKGFRLFERNGFLLYGNLFQGKHHQKKFDLQNIELVIATNPNMQLVETAFKRQLPVIFYALFPDQITGWDYQLNHYQKGLKKAFQKRVGLCRFLLANSAFTLNLLKARLGASLMPKSKICFLGVDVKSIEKAKPLWPRQAKKLRVLWNHMWRLDKGFPTALTLILSLAQKYPNTEFYLGRKERWGGKHQKQAKQAYHQFLDYLRQKNLTNIYIIDTFEQQEEYWSFLRSMSIGFSCSPHETFGLSMMEQAAAGLACVVPDGAVYPEVHRAALLVPKDKIGKALESLLTNPKKRITIALRCQEWAKRFAVERFVSQITKIIRENIVDQ